MRVSNKMIVQYSMIVQKLDQYFFGCWYQNIDIIYSVIWALTFKIALVVA